MKRRPSPVTRAAAALLVATALSVRLNLSREGSAQRVAGQAGTPAQPSTAPQRHTRRDPAAAVGRWRDHQTGLFQTVKDISVSAWRSKTTALAQLTTLMKVPVITTASEPNGPNGP